MILGLRRGDRVWFDNQWYHVDKNLNIHESEIPRRCRMTTTKWVAGFNFSGDVVVAQCRCRETKRQVIMEHHQGGEGWEAFPIVEYRTRFSHDEAAEIFHDTSEEALEALHRRELKTIAEARQTISKAQDRMNKIDDFGVER